MASRTIEYIFCFGSLAVDQCQILKKRAKIWKAENEYLNINNESAIHLRWLINEDIIHSSVMDTCSSADYGYFRPAQYMSAPGAEINDQRKSAFMVKDIVGVDSSLPYDSFGDSVGSKFSHPDTESCAGSFGYQPPEESSQSQRKKASMQRRKRHELPQGETVAGW